MPEVIERRGDLTTVTPMMKQYLDVKNQYEGYILFYRLGDFYECFYEDAIIASRELELTLTGRDCGEGKRAAMCGVPFHKSDLYVGKLVEKGFKVAICEQVSDPKSSVGLVKREVTRVVTPGTVTDSGLLNESTNNYLAAICFGISGVGLSVADISTGEFSSTYFESKDYLQRLLNELGAYQPREVIINIEQTSCEEVVSFLRERCRALINANQSALFNYESSKKTISETFAGREEKLTLPEMLMSAGALLAYIRETQKTEVTFGKEIDTYKEGQFLELDLNTRRNLELTESMRAKEKRGSLIWVLDKTRTAMGARLLRSWLLKPLLNPVTILNRQAMVSDFASAHMLRDEIGELLSATLDLERLTAKVVYGTANARDLRAIYQSIEKLPEIKSLISKSNCNKLRALADKIDALEDLASLLGRAIVDTPPLTVREGGMIREGFHTQVDYLRAIKNGGKDAMAELEEREKAATGIKNLKVSYNKVFGFYIEISKSAGETVPLHYVRKQTLSNCERYITEELKEMENTVFNADEKLVTLEYDLFCQIKDIVAENNARISSTAAIIAEIDVYRSFAEVAVKNAYVAPEVDLSSDLIIKDGRHPVVEKFVTDSYFVPNDTLLDTGKNRMMIITGPNMAGKSTYMRQVAIITIMAQIGSFVPAKYAKVGIVDKLFTRVGASDDLASGQSTFMLEMNEVATILKNATKRSLIIYDEVGRGTSTFDGMAIARAVVEYTHSKKIGAKTLFATHYHELIDMEELHEGIVNYNIAAKKRGDSITFLRKIVRGGTDDSYGIEVAKLAGVPAEVVKRAREILKEIESGTRVVTVSKSDACAPKIDLFSTIMASKDSEVSERLRGIDINTLTPIEAINIIFELKKLLED